MKVLQLPAEFAGQVNLTAQGLRAIGHKASNVAEPNPFGYPYDIDPRIKFGSRILKTKNPFIFFSWAEHFDLFHYHRSPYLAKGIDLKYLQRRKKPFFIEFWGSDIRIYDIEKERNPFFITDRSNSPRKKIPRLQFWSGYTDEVIMSDNSLDIFLKPYFKKIHIVRQRIDTDRYQPVYPDPQNHKPKVVHAPSHTEVKGTKYVEKAVEALQKKGLVFEYVRVHNMPHQKAIQIYAQADIIVDQLTLGSHGVFACEGMALGKPVICYIHEDILPTYPEGFPIVNATPLTIEEVLEELIVSSEMRYKIGMASRKYTEKVHDYRRVAKRLINIYRQRLNE